jgi:sugar phosphate isomerase/epimerase
MKKVSISSWAIPLPLPELCEGAKKLGFDGISLGGFPPFGAHPDIVDTPEKKEALVWVFKKNGLEVADFALDMWKYDSLKMTDEWRKEYSRALKCAAELGLTDIMRVDTCTPPILPSGITYKEAKKFFVRHFREMAKEAAGYGFKVVWEFEPGFMINEPENVIEVHDAVGEDNFSLLFDTCHAYNCSLGHRNIEEGCALKGGILEFIGMAKDRIGLVHVIDCDGTLNETGTSTHAPFGEGFINFDKVIPELLNKAGYKGDWWAIDLCEWPDAWKVTERCKLFVDEFNKKYCG